MAPFVDMKGLLERDREVKGGRELDEESINLTAIYEGRARQLTRIWLEQLGQGDSANKKPLQTKLLKRLVQSAAVIWSRPPTRRCVLDKVPLPDDSDDAQTLEAMYRAVDPGMKLGDRWRTLVGTSVPYFAPSNRRRRPNIRVYQPHNVARDPDDTEADDIASDARVAFKVRHSDDRELSVWHYWTHEDDGTWRAFRVFESGELVQGENELYPGGQPPFDVAPFVVLYDENPGGRAWVPIDETRTAFALSFSVVLAELLYLVKQEAHTGLAISGVQNAQEMPKRWGPGELWGFEDPEARVQPIQLNPKLLESVQISKHLLETFATGEGLPADYFLSSRRYETGAACKLREKDIEARREDQSQSALETEQDVAEIVIAMTNAYSDEWGAQFTEDVGVSVELGEPWQAIDPKEMQEVHAFDLSIGAESIIDYLQERKRFTRAQAIAYFERVSVDRERYPLRENPAALLGQRNAGGPGSATPTGAGEADVQRDSSTINPNRAASNEQGSVAGAARRGVRVA